MQQAISLTSDIYWVGVNDKETDLFESLWPLPKGVSYNSYLIVDKKVALVDTVKISYQDSFLDKIERILGDKKVDYLIINHMEPDHSGSIKALKRAYPEMEIVGNAKTMEFLAGFYGIKGSRVVKDGDCLDLGRHQLRFYLTPMVHWPETMMTFDETESILFSGDAFGGFGALTGGLFDDEIDLPFYEEEIRRYYTNIVAKYSPMVQKAIQRFANTDIKMIASTHGPVWRENPQYIIEQYNKWSDYQTETGVVIVYGSMYGNTKVMAEEIARALTAKGIEKIRLYDVSRTHVSYLLKDIWNYKGLIIGSCTYNTELFPPIAQLIKGLLNRRIKNQLLGIFGSYSWSGGAVKEIKEFGDKLKLQTVEPIIEAKFAPNQDILKECRLLGENMAQALLK